MLNIDLSPCLSVDDVRRATKEALLGRTLAGSRAEARRLFRREGYKDHIRTEMVFRDTRELHQVGPIHRNILVVTVIWRFTPARNPEKELYSIDIVTY